MFPRRNFAVFLGLLLLAGSGLSGCRLSGNLREDDTLFSRSEKKPGPKPESAAPTSPRKPAPTPSPKATKTGEAKAPIAARPTMTPLPARSNLNESPRGRTLAERLERASAEELPSLRTELEALTTREPQNVAARINLAVLQEELGDRGRAIDLYRDALRIQPGNAEACTRLSQMMEGDKGISQLTECLEKGPAAEDRFRLLLARSDMQSERGVKERARRDLATARNLQPTSWRLYRQTGRLFERERKWFQAELYYQKALSETSGTRTPEESADLQYRLAEVARSDSRLAEAIRLYRQTLTVDPNHPGALFALGQIALQNGDSRTAADSFERLANAQPRQASHWIYVGAAKSQLGDVAGAEIAYFRAIKLQARSAEAYFNLGILYQDQKKDLLKALYFYQRFADLDPAAAREKPIQERINNAKRDSQRKSGR